MIDKNKVIKGLQTCNRYDYNCRFRGLQKNLKDIRNCHMRLQMGLTMSLTCGKVGEANGQGEGYQGI